MSSTASQYGSRHLKILLLSKYERLGASSRIRSYQYLPKLAEFGIETVARPLFGDGYLRDLYVGDRRRIAHVVTAYAKRLAELVSLRHYDLLWIEKEVFPWCPAVTEIVLRHAGQPFVVDYDDAVFEFHSGGRRSALRGIHSLNTRCVMRNAAVVITGNRYLAEYARQAKAHRVVELPSVVDVTRYSVAPKRSGGTLRVGWIGTPLTARYLEFVKPALEAVGKTHSLHFIAIGPRAVDMGTCSSERRPWSEDTEVGDVQSLDVGIMPLPDSGLTRGKSGYKLIQYMGCGIPVVASPVGANVDIVDHGINGLLASSVHEWTRALDTLARDPELRMKMGMNGRAKVEAEFSVQKVAPTLAKVLRSALDDTIGRDTV